MTSFFFFFFFHHQPVLKSQEPSPEDSKGPVMVLKGKTFSQIVSEGGKGWVGCECLYGHGLLLSS